MRLQYFRLDRADGMSSKNSLTLLNQDPHLMKNTTNPQQSSPNVSSTIIGFIALVMSYHYLLSYRWFRGIFKIHGISDFSLLTFEDISFPFSGVNFRIILTSVTFFCLIYIISAFVSIQAIEEWRDKEISHFKKQNKIIKLLILLVLTVVIILVIRLFSGYNTFLMVFTVPILLITPIIYLVIPRIRYAIGLLFVVSFFVWGFEVMDYALKEYEHSVTQGIQEKKAIVFDFGDQRIETSDSLHYVVTTHDYLVLKENDGTIKLYPRKDIGLLRIKQKERID